jgi:hypothetical protein
MSVELVHVAPTLDTKRRLIRMTTDVRALNGLHRGEVRAVYDRIEALRDALSRLLDRADDKHA